jgi:hypothetical protein
MNTLDVCTLTSVPFEGCIAKGREYMYWKSSSTITSQGFSTENN